MNEWFHCTILFATLVSKQKFVNDFKDWLTGVVHFVISIFCGHNLIIFPCLRLLDSPLSWQNLCPLGSFSLWVFHPCSVVSLGDEWEIFTCTLNFLHSLVEEDCDLIFPNSGSLFPNHLLFFFFYWYLIATNVSSF